jgi:steroid delta-isomerase-like uncharacterized protein
MTTEANKAVVQAFYDAINRREFDTLAQSSHPDLTFYHQLDTPHYGDEGFVASEQQNFEAFDDWTMPIIEMIAEGDKVAAYLVFQGIHSGVHQGLPATGKHIRFSLLMLLTLKDGQIIEKRAHFDRTDIRNQLT